MPRGRKAKSLVGKSSRSSREDDAVPESERGQFPRKGGVLGKAGFLAQPGSRCLNFARQEGEPRFKGKSQCV